MSTSTALTETHHRRGLASLSTAFSGGAVLATLGSLAYISLNALPPREAYAHPIGVGGGILAVAGCLILAFGLARWRTTLPSWAVLASAAGLFVAAASAFADTTYGVAAALKTDNELFEELFFGSSWLLGGIAPKSLLCLTGFLAIAIAGWRQRSIPRPAAALLGVAGILSIWPPYPPGLIVASIAFFIVSRGPLEIRS